MFPPPPKKKKLGYSKLPMLLIFMFANPKNITILDTRVTSSDIYPNF